MRNEVEDSPAISQIISRVKSVTGLDFNLYKRPTLLRRIARRIDVRGYSTIDNYLALLDDDDCEVEILAQECLVGVTRFFRDPLAWDALATQVLAPLVAERKATGSQQDIRIWSVGCSTGEEVYTVGILLLEEMERQGIDLPVKIVGTDISEQFLSVASRGIYPDSIVDDVQADRLARHFVKRGADYHVAPELRSVAIFSPHDVIRDPPLNDLDVVICRNVLIYLQRAAQLRAMNSVHYALRLGGALMLGPSEHIGDVNTSLQATDAKAHLYRNQRPSRGLTFGVAGEPEPQNPTRPRQPARPSSMEAEGAKAFGDATTETPSGEVSTPAVAIEALEAANEELLASNEELMAANEALQSANEELQGMNEELQSLTEELHAVNAEHQQKISDLAELNDGMDNLLRGRQSDMFQQVLEAAMAGYWEYRPDTGEFYMSPSFKAMVGRREDEVSNTLEGLRQLVHPDDLAAVDSELERLVAISAEHPPPSLSGVLCEMETRFHHTDGSVVWMWCRGNVVVDDDGSVRAVGCYVDVTDLKLIEADLLRSNDELKQFAYLTSHDLQEPLRTVSNFVEVLERRYSHSLDDDGRKYLGIVMQATQRMQRLIRGILDYSRIGREVSEEVVDVGSVVEAVIDDLDSAICEAGAEVQVKPMPKVIGYESELRMLFSNLISNAVKFSRPDVAPLVEVDARRLDGSRWRFSVADNGIGVEPEHRERIFEIFNRLHTRDEFEGAGIGLAHARKIVELHGGSISMESEYGAGSTIHFDLALGDS